MERYLPLEWCIIWFLVMIPFVAVGARKIIRIIREHPEQKMTVALSGAFIFLLSSLKLPSATGSSSHPTGTGLAVVLYGVCACSALSLTDDKAVDAALDSAGLSEASRGIYGKSARRAKDIANIGIEFFYGAHENCMIRCMEGKDVVLLCDPAMVDVAVCGVGFMERAGFGKMPVKVLPEVSG